MTYIWKIKLENLITICNNIVYYTKKNLEGTLNLIYLASKICIKL